MTEVKPGQLWVDNARCNYMVKRFVAVREIDQDRAVCEAWYDVVGTKSRTVRIKLSRFKPTSTGYRLATARECREQGFEAQS